LNAKSEKGDRRASAEGEMTADPNNSPPGADWRALVRKNGTPEFHAAFAHDAMLEASVLDRPLVGSDEIGAFFAATTGGMYEHLSFVAEMKAGYTTLLEWTGRAFGLDLRGATIVTRNAAGQIQTVRLFHSPHPVVVKFASELAGRLAGASNSVKRPRAANPVPVTSITQEH
jgi:hypothetical protein